MTDDLFTKERKRMRNDKQDAFKPDFSWQYYLQWNKKNIRRRNGRKICCSSESTSGSKLKILLEQKLL